MYSKLLTLLFSFLLTFGYIQAQDSKAVLQRNPNAASKSGQLKVQDNATAAAKKQQMVQNKLDAARNGALTNMASDIQLNADEEKRAINAYKIDFASNPYSTPDNAVVRIALYNGTAKEQTQIGTINFYSKGSKMLAERKVLDDKKMITLNYDLDSFSIVQQTLAQGKRLNLVHNNKTKEAYITTDVVATFTK
jgi:hypothetical protein